MQYTFGAYVLDTQQYELYRDGIRLSLRPKAFQVLMYLLAHRERVVSRAELLEHVWAEAYVGDAALSSCLKVIRRVLEDDGQEQRIIRTMRKYGYRFVAPVAEIARPTVPSEPAPFPEKSASFTARPTTAPVGRDLELTHLHHCFSRALQGERHIVFVTGETGIGKTTLEDVQENGTHYIEAEIWRLQGELLLRQAAPETSRAAACLQHALEVARSQQARWWELRSVVSLGRLWQQHGQYEPARQLLKEISGWFTEGFDTADLQEAKALLAALR